MTLLALSAGLTSQVPLADRGFAYGDGLFETMAVREGQIRLLDGHLRRLQEGLERLAIGGLSAAELAGPLSAAAQASRRLPACEAGAVLKLVVTRGEGPRGYAPPPTAVPHWWIQAFPWVPPPENPLPARVRTSTVRLAPQPLLAGLKHLNRLEQVLARQQDPAPQADEILMLDHDGYLTCAGAANVFLVHRGELVTPLLDRCGVAGVVRQALLDASAAGGIPWRATVRRIVPAELADAEEMFLTSALRGVWAVGAVDGDPFPTGSVAAGLTRWWRELR